MQTFLPYASFEDTAKCLDYRRLGKQRVEALQILQAITNPKYGWQNHPAVKMWKGYHLALSAYGITMCIEWINRGYKDTCREKIMVQFNIDDKYYYDIMQDINRYHERLLICPSWLFNRKVHLSHRSNLLRKDEIYYSQFNWKVSNDLPYHWPVT